MKLRFRLIQINLNISTFLLPSSSSSLKFNKLSLWTKFNKLPLWANVISEAAIIRQSLNAVGVENKFVQHMLAEEIVRAIIQIIRVYSMNIHIMIVLIVNQKLKGVKRHVDGFASACAQ